MKSPKFLLAFSLLSALLPVAINLWQLLSLMASRDDAPLTLRKEGNAPSIRSKILPIVEHGVSCGNHRASACAECTQGHGKSWCNGDCVWSQSNGVCQRKTSLTVNCGGARSAQICADCPLIEGNDGESLCSGDCSWWPYNNNASGLCLPFDCPTTAGLNNAVSNTNSSSSRTCLRNHLPHPVPGREEKSDKDMSSYASLASIRMLHKPLSQRVRKYLPHLRESAAVQKIQKHPLERKCARSQIPKKLHWIWFGGELPHEYVINIEAMAMLNPGWEAYLWSEVPSKILEDRLETHDVKYNFRNITEYIEQNLLVNGDIILKEENAGGKSDYLRYEVIYMEGGIYLDIDHRPVQPFDNFGGIFRWPFCAYDIGYPVSYHEKSSPPFCI